MTLLRAQLENGASGSSVQAVRLQAQGHLEEAVTLYAVICHLGSAPSVTASSWSAQRSSPAHPTGNRAREISLRSPSNMHLELFETFMQEIPYTYPRMKQFSKCLQNK